MEQTQLSEVCNLMAKYINSLNAYEYSSQSGFYDPKDRNNAITRIEDLLSVIESKLKELGFPIYVYE